MRAGEILLEAEDVVDLSPAPAIDRLVVIADTANVLRALRQKAQPQILRNVRILIFVDQHIAELVVIFLQQIRVLLKDRDVVN